VSDPECVKDIVPDCGGLPGAEPAFPSCRPATVGVLFHPVGETQMPDGTFRDNKEIADEIAESLQAGSHIIVLPSVTDENGTRLWDFRLERGG
jgi:hypothetical protein